MELIFKKVGIIDLDTLQTISERTCRATYEALNEPDHFQRYVEKAFSRHQLQQELAIPNSDFYFAYAGDALAGYIKVNYSCAEAGLSAKESVELERIYLMRLFQNQGLGEQLIQQAVQLGTIAGFKHLWLGVWQKNPKAIRFYQRQGFEIIGEHDFFIGEDCQKDWIMRKVL